MLVLTRKKNETIHIGQEVVIKVISTGKGKVKIGIEAPGAVRVRRGELAGPQESSPEDDGVAGKSLRHVLLV
ncbi:MAG: carbon storage regulator [Planctomycetaceae bacterium]|nr:carbon storage regulator [Planctomycetaceae bacterium]